MENNVSPEMPPVENLCVHLFSSSKNCRNFLSDPILFHSFYRIDFLLFVTTSQKQTGKRILKVKILGAVVNLDEAEVGRSARQHFSTHLLAQGVLAGHL